MCSVVGALSLAVSCQGQSIGIGEATLRFEATGSAMYLSNPYLRDDALETIIPVESSFAFLATPSAHLELGDENSRYLVTSVASLAMRRMESLSELDAEDLSLTFGASYRGDRGNWRLNASSQEFSLPRHESRFGAESPTGTTTAAGFLGNYRYSTRTRLSSGIDFSERAYDDSPNQNYNDYKSLSVPLRVFYAINETLELGAGGRYRERNYEGSNDLPDDIAWHLALEGQVSSKVTADLKVGVLDQIGSRALSSASDGSLFLSARTTWQSSTDTRITLSASSDTNSSGISDSIQTERFSLSSAWRVSDKLHAQARYQFSNESYGRSSRRDDSQILSASLSFRPDSQLILSLSLSYEENDSSQFGFDYTALTTSWTGGWRF